MTNTKSPISHSDSVFTHESIDPAKFYVYAELNGLILAQQSWWFELVCLPRQHKNANTMLPSKVEHEGKDQSGKIF